MRNQLPEDFLYRVIYMGDQTLTCGGCCNTLLLQLRATRYPWAGECGACGKNFRKSTDPMVN